MVQKRILKLRLGWEESCYSATLLGIFSLLDTIQKLRVGARNEMEADGDVNFYFPVALGSTPVSLVRTSYFLPVIFLSDLKQSPTRCLCVTT